MPWSELVKFFAASSAASRPLRAALPGCIGLHHRAEHLAQARGLRRRDAQRPDHLLLGEAEQPARRRGGAEHARRAGDVPADVVVRRIDGVADAALGLHAQDEGVQEIRAADRRAFREREDGGRDRAARVDDGLQMRVVEVEGVRGDAVHQRREHDVEPVAAPEHGRLARPGELVERRERALHRLVARAADRAAHPVQERARRLVPDFLRESRRVDARR